MKFLLILAWKNLSRYKKRTAITSLSIATGLAFYIILDSMIIGSIIDSTRNLNRYETGFGVIQTKEYWLEKDLLPLDFCIENPLEIYTLLSEISTGYAPRVNFTSDLIVYKDPYPEDGNIPVKVTAIDPALDSEVFDIIKSVSRGHFPGEEEDGIVIGEWLAEDLGADIGYPVTLITRTKNGYYQVLDLVITGIAFTDNPVVNRDGLFINIAAADFFLEMEGAVTDIYPAFKGSKKEIAGIEEKLREKLPAYSAAYYTWREIAPDFVAASDMDRQGSFIMIFIVFIIAAVGISNTMMMSIFERTAETGMMRAIGVKDNSVKWLFRIEAAGIGVIGSAAGTAAGGVLNYFIVRYGIDYSWLMREGNFGYRVTGIVRGVFNPGTFAGAFAAGVILSFLISFIPTAKAVKQSIPACLRDSG